MSVAVSNSAGSSTDSVSDNACEYCDVHILSTVDSLYGRRKLRDSGAELNTHCRHVTNHDANQRPCALLNGTPVLPAVLKSSFSTDHNT
eukprot:6197-Heterococcus_DN1.PRE.1